MTAVSFSSTRQRILDAAGRLLAEGGRDAVSTRNVSAAARVQPQAIYRQFGDMATLLDAATHEGFRLYIASKSARRRRADPIDDLRDGWDLHVEFGLQNPALYLLMYGSPDSSREVAAAREAEAILRELVAAVARAGRLRLDIDASVAMIHATGVGVVTTLISGDKAVGRTGLSDRVREAVIDAITSRDSGEEQVSSIVNPVPHAVALRAFLTSATLDLTPGEQLLLDELLGRIGDAS